MTEHIAEQIAKQNINKQQKKTVVTILISDRNAIHNNDQGLIHKEDITILNLNSKKS